MTLRPQRSFGTLALAVPLLAFVLGGCSLAAPEAEDFDDSAAALTIPNVKLQTVLQSRFVGAQNNGGGAVNATATVAQAWETFSFEDINGGTLQSGDSVFVRAGNGQYFQAVNGGGSTLNAASNNTLGWETFKVVKQSGTGTINNGDVIGLQTSNGSWVSAQNGGGGTVYANGAALNSWEQFKITGLPGSPVTVSGVTLRTQLQSRYVGAQNNGGGAVNATATVAQGWETFSVIDLNGGSLQSGDQVRVRTGGGQYFQALNGGGSSLNASATTPSTWETFKIVRSAGAGTIATGDVVGLQTSTGSWVSAQDGGGGTVYANGAALSSWESFVFGIGSTTPPPSSRTRVIGYMPNWYGSYSSWASRIDWSKLTHVNLAFVTADSAGNLQLAPNSEVDALVSTAHANGVKVFPSLGGAGGDATIAPHYEGSSVDAFVDKIINYVVARKLDGIDVDMEAPDRMGAKYDAFIAKLIAKARPRGLPVTAAVSQWMQSGMSDTTLRSFDLVNIMSYDNAGTWSGAGAHSSYEQAVTALNYYTNKGVAKDKLVLGVPFYGYCWGSCDGASSSYVLYKDILAKFPNAWNSDWIDTGTAKYSYNGTGTMTRKTDLAQQYGGIMIWELAGDVSTSQSTSLLRTIDTAAR